MTRLTRHEIDMAEQDEDFFECYEKFHNNKVVRPRQDEPDTSEDAQDGD